MLVLWENMCDPIITGREELGSPKIYCDIPEPRTYGGVTHCIALWRGFKFADLALTKMKQLSPRDAQAVMARNKSDGMLQYKYMPRTGELGKPDAAYVTLSPGAGPTHVKEVWVGEGTVRFHRATWEDLPTQYRIVNALRRLEIKEYRGAMIVKTLGSGDLSDTHILR